MHRPEGGSSCVEKHRLLRNWGLLSNCSSEAADSCVWLQTGPNAVVLKGPELWQTRKAEASNRWDPASVWTRSRPPYSISQVHALLE